MRRFNYTADSSFEGKQVSAFLRHIGCSGAIITKLKIGDRLTVNGITVRTIDKLHDGDKISLLLEDESDIVSNGTLNVRVAYEDEDVIVYDKPADMAVHPSLNHYNDTLANCFAASFPDCTFRSVNRLDRNTSGLCAVAKNQLAAARLSGSSPDHPQKLYYAIVGGRLSGSGNITAPIARVSDSIMLRTVREDGQYASTSYRVLAANEAMSYVEITLETGRTHQIRVHFSYIGHPLLGDDLYGGSRELIGRHALHCGQLTFRHPVTRALITVKAPLHADMRELVDSVANE